MLKNWKYFLIFSVFQYCLLSYSPNFIQSVTTGSLSDSWQFSFTVFVQDFNGIILHCIDSSGSQLEIKITQGKDSDIRDLRLQFNGVYRDVPVKELCGCDPCDNQNLTVFATLNVAVISLICNNRVKNSLPLAIKFEQSKYPTHQRPLMIANTSNKIFLMIGNNGPYLREDGTLVDSIKDQFVGCLHTFSSDNQPLSFVGNGTNVLPKCLNLCNNTVCNGGFCQQVNFSKYTCICNTTALNGQYCNKGMKMYNQNGHNTFGLLSDVYDVYLKMTWKLVLANTYCLMEIVTRKSNITIYTTTDHLKLNNETLSKTSIDKVYFFIIDIGKKNLIIKINNDNYEKLVSANEIMRINVGFSSSFNGCQTLEGPYDFYFEPSKLQFIIPNMPGSNFSETTTSKQRNYVTTKLTQNQTIIAFTALPTILFITLLVILLIIYHQLRKNKSNTSIVADQIINQGDMVSPTIASANQYSSLDYGNIYNDSKSIPDEYGYLPMIRRDDISPPLPPRVVEAP